MAVLGHRDRFLRRRLLAPSRSSACSRSGSPASGTSSLSTMDDLATARHRLLDHHVDRRRLELDQEQVGLDRSRARPAAPRAGRGCPRRARPRRRMRSRGARPSAGSAASGAVVKSAVFFPATGDERTRPHRGGDHRQLGAERGERSAQLVEPRARLGEAEHDQVGDEDAIGVQIAAGQLGVLVGADDEHAPVGWRPAAARRPLPSKMTSSGWRSSASSAASATFE